MRETIDTFCKPSEDKSEYKERGRVAEVVIITHEYAFRQIV